MGKEPKRKNEKSKVVNKSPVDNIHPALTRLSDTLPIEQYRKMKADISQNDKNNATSGCGS